MVTERRTPNLVATGRSFFALVMFATHTSISKASSDFISELSGCGGQRRCHVSVTSSSRRRATAPGETSYVDDWPTSIRLLPHLSYWRSLDADSNRAGLPRYWSRSDEFRDQLAGLPASTDMAPYLSL